MANCNFCNVSNKKLYKSLYQHYKVYACKRCVANFELELREKESA
jgi:hypothetical protein